MNKVIIMGRVTKEVQINMAGETKVGRYTLAVNRRFKRDGQPDADFIPCIVFGKQADFAEKYLAKGTKIAVVGRIQTGSYTNKDGQRVYTTDVVVEEQEFAESKKVATQNAAPAAPADEGFATIPEDAEDELPFI